MSLPMFSHPWELLLNKIWWKSMRGMFEIFTPIFLFLQPRGRKIRSDTKKYISEWSSGYELYWGTWVFIPKWWDHMKKWLRKHDENHEVLEPRFLSLPSCSRQLARWFACLLAPLTQSLPSLWESVLLDVSKRPGIVPQCIARLGCQVHAWTVIAWDSGHSK